MTLQSMSQPAYFYDESALLERLLTGLKRRTQQVVFVLGSGLSAPMAPGTPGVPTVNGVIELIRREFEDDVTQLAHFDRTLTDAGTNQYQAAFLFLQGRRGPNIASEVVRSAVLGSWVSDPANFTDMSQTTIKDSARMMESDLQACSLNPGTAAAGRLGA